MPAGPAAGRGDGAGGGGTACCSGGLHEGCLTGSMFPAAPPSGKGMRVLQRVGVMEQVAVVLPAAVEGVWAC